MLSKYLDESSVSYLVTSNPKQIPYDYVIVNDTPLDRNYAREFEDFEGHKFTSIGHYIEYNRICHLGLSMECKEQYLKEYRGTYPTKQNGGTLDFIIAMEEKYKDEFTFVSQELKYSWIKKRLIVGCEGIKLATEQCGEFKRALQKSGNKVLIEHSDSISWGLETDKGSFLIFAYPNRWSSDNGWGQCLMAMRAMLSSKKGLFSK